jgi:hypothetical protein
VELVVFERRCCPTLSFDIGFEASGPIRFRVTGMDGAMLRSLGLGDG